LKEFKLVQIIFRRLWWRVAGSPVERAEAWRSKASDRVPLRAIRAYLAREHSPAALRVRALHEVISRELLDLQRARHTLAAGNTISFKKKEGAA
jgi:hypothetical protein